jgi:hypothetical protein
MSTASPAPPKIISAALFALQNAEAEVVNLIRESGLQSRSDLAELARYSRAKIIPSFDRRRYQQFWSALTCLTLEQHLAPFAAHRKICSPSTRSTRNSLSLDLTLMARFF